MNKTTETEMLMYDKSELIAEIVCLQAQLDTESKATSVIADKLKAAIDENVELEDSFQTYFDISTELAADVTNLEAQNKVLVEALGRVRGLIPENPSEGFPFNGSFYPSFYSSVSNNAVLFIDELIETLATIDKGESEWVDVEHEPPLPDSWYWCQGNIGYAVVVRPYYFDALSEWHTDHDFLHESYIKTPIPIPSEDKGESDA